MRLVKTTPRFPVVLFALAAFALSPFSLRAETLEMVLIYQPLSLHGTDGSGEMDETDAALPASVLPRPMVMSGALPEELVDAVQESHKVATKSVGYKVEEANLLALCGIRVEVELKEKRLFVQMDVSKLEIPEEVDLTVRQILKLGIIAIRKTLAAYYEGTEDKSLCQIEIVGTTEETDGLKDLKTEFVMGE